MANYLDSAGLNALWTKIKQRISDGVGDIDLTPYLKIENLATVNGEKLSEGGNITIDLTLFKVVETLPTTDIDENKIYLVKSAETDTGNVYTEYIYANKAWEKLGEYKSEVDLTPYAKTTDVDNKLATKVDKVTGKALSANDFTDAYKTKLDNIATGANNYTLPTASASTLGGVKVGANLTIDGSGVLSAKDTTYSAATTSASGLMSATDKAKLDGIAAGANNYTHPASAAGAKASGLYKITTDANGHVTAATAVAKADITALGIPAQDTTYSDVTTTAHGLMTAADKTKLNGIAASATADAAIPVSEVEALS